MLNVICHYDKCHMRFPKDRGVLFQGKTYCTLLCLQSKLKDEMIPANRETKRVWSSLDCRGN